MTTNRRKKRIGRNITTILKDFEGV